MARAIWSGIIGFGLVTIPVKLYKATEDKDIGFHQLHDKCKTRIRELRWCPHCNMEVPWDHIEKGYEYAKGQYISLTAEDLEKLPLPSKNAVNVTAFVSKDEVDPIYFEQSYYVEPQKTGKHAFALLIQALVGKSSYAIGSVTIRTKERPCALRPIGTVLILSTLNYPDEIRVDLSAKAPSIKVSRSEMTMANSLIDLLAQKFDPEQFQNNYREALSKIIDARLEGLAPEEMPVHTEHGKVLDLMEALRNSVNQAKSRTARKSSVGTSRSPRTKAKSRKKKTSSRLRSGAA